MKISWVAIVRVGMSLVWVSVDLPLHISICVAIETTSGVVFQALSFAILLSFLCSLLTVFWSFWYLCLSFFSFSLATRLFWGASFTLIGSSIASASKDYCCLSWLCSNRTVSPEWLFDSWITSVSASFSWSEGRISVCLESSRDWASIKLGSSDPPGYMYGFRFARTWAIPVSKSCRISFWGLMVDAWGSSSSFSSSSSRWCALSYLEFGLSSSLGSCLELASSSVLILDDILPLVQFLPLVLTQVLYTNWSRWFYRFFGAIYRHSLD